MLYFTKSVSKYASMQTSTSLTYLEHNASHAMPHAILPNSAVRGLFKRIFVRIYINKHSGFHSLNARGKGKRTTTFTTRCKDASVTSGKL